MSKDRVQPSIFPCQMKGSQAKVKARRSLGTSAGAMTELNDRSCQYKTPRRLDCLICCHLLHSHPDLSSRSCTRKVLCLRSVCLSTVGVRTVGRVDARDDVYMEPPIQVGSCVLCSGVPYYSKQRERGSVAPNKGKGRERESERGKGRMMPSRRREVES